MSEVICSQKLIYLYFALADKRTRAKIWKNFEKLIKIELESKPTYGYDDKYIKTKIQKYADSIVTNFHNKKMPKGKVPCRCLSIIMLDSVIESHEKYHPQTFLGERKYVQ